jgi:hypothetical protein
MKFKRMVVIGVSVPLALCICLLGMIVIHDTTSPHWESELSSLRGYEDVQATLESNLMIGQSTRESVLSFLQQQEALDKCYQTNEGIFCWIPTRLPVLSPDNPLVLKDMRLYNLWTEYNYKLIFRFRNNRLSEIEVSEHGAGL